MPKLTSPPLYGEPEESMSDDPRALHRGSNALKERFRVRRGKAFAAAVSLLATAFVAGACASPPPPDPYCSNAPLPGGADVKSGQGALQVEGTTSAYFYVLDPTGKPVNHQSLGRTLAVDPGNIS